MAAPNREKSKDKEEEVILMIRIRRFWSLASLEETGANPDPNILSKCNFNRSVSLSQFLSIIRNTQFCNTIKMIMPIE